MKIVIIKSAQKLPPPPRDYISDEHCAVEALLMLSQSILPSSSKPSAAKNPAPAAATPPVAALCAKNPTPAAATPPFAAICPKKPQDLSLLPPSSPYVCEICGAAYKTHQALGGHKTRHRKLTAAAAPTVSGSRNNDRVHECSICQKRFSTGQALGGHKRQHYEGKIGGPSKSAKTSSTGSPGRDSCQVTVIEDEGPSHASSRHDFDLNLPYTQDISE